MVGLGLGVSTDEGFVPYFVAITFHQFFDGCGEAIICTPNLSGPFF